MFVFCEKKFLPIMTRFQKSDGNIVLQFDEFLCYRKQETISNILVGLKAAELSQIILHRVRETVGESKRSDSIRSGRRALFETFYKGTNSRRFFFFFFFLAIPILVIWPKILGISK